MGEKNKIDRAFVIAALTAMSVFATASAVIASFQVFYWLPMGYGEDCVLTGAWALLNGKGLYRVEEVHAIPSILSLYAPVFYLIEAAFLKIWGIDHAPGRIFAMLMTFSCAATIGFIIRKRGGDTAAALVGGLFFLCCWPVVIWMRQLRVDSTAIFFELAAVYALLGPFSRKRLALFVVFGVLAGYTKQTAFALVAGALIGRLVEGDARVRRETLYYSMTYAATAALVFVAIDLATGGGFHRIAMGSHFIQHTSDKLFEVVGSVLRDPVSLCLLVLAAIFALKKPLSFDGIFLVVPFAIASALAGKNGANVNYFLETLAAAAIIVGRNFASADAENGWARYKKPVMCALVVVAIILSGARKSGVVTVWTMQIRQEKNYRTPELVEYLKRFPPGSLVYTHQPATPLMAGLLPAATDPFNITAMSRVGAWDTTALRTMIAEKKIVAIVMPQKIDPSIKSDFIPDDVAAEMLDNYVLLKKTYNKQFVYVPGEGR